MQAPRATPRSPGLHLGILGFVRGLRSIELQGLKGSWGFRV